MARYIDANTWISVNDRMPELNVANNNLEIGETVFALAKDGSRYIGHFENFRYDSSSVFIGSEIEEYSISFVQEQIEPSRITHWMPFPSPSEG